MAQFEHLPSIQFTTHNGGLALVRTRPSTDRLIIIAPAVDGPTEQIIDAQTIVSPENLYGPINFTSSYTRPSGVGSAELFNGNHLMKAVREAMSAGAASIYLLRVGGTKATDSLTIAGNAASGDLTANALYAGRIYNSVTLTFTSGAASGKCVVAQPDVKGGAFTLSWSGESSGLTVREAIDRLNTDGRNRTFVLQNDSVDGTVAARLLNGTITLTGGLDGTFRDDADYRVNLYEAFQDAFQFLEDEGFEVDVNLIAGLYLDDKVAGDNTTSVAQDFAEYLARRSMDHPQIGVIGVRPLANLSSRSKIVERYDALVTEDAGAFGAVSDKCTNAGYFMHQGFRYQDSTTGLDIDAGAYLQVVAGDVYISDRDVSLYTESAAAVYAGTLCRLKPYKAASNELVRGIYDLPYTYSRTQLNALTGGLGRDATRAYEGAGAYVTVRKNRGVVFTRDVTASARDNDFRDLQPLRLANAVHKGVKDLVFPYLGGPNDISVRLGLETKIKGFLDGLADARALLGGENVGYTLEVLGADSDPFSNILGILQINMTLVPALQIKEIRVSVRMSRQL
jgi:hypothetical protein